jgi:hypothetical protein
MPLTNPLPQGIYDDELKTDASVPISGINNSMPPSAIDTKMGADAQNRLAQLDGLNRPRPGLKRLAQSATGTLDSVHHVGNGLFLANSGPTWYTWDNRSSVWTTISGGPAFATGSQVYSAVANTALYFSNGTTLNKYDPAVPGFSVISVPSQYPNVLYPTWTVFRLLYAYQNTLVCSDLLNPEHVDVITGTVTLDPVSTDLITGIALWKDQKIAVFRHGSTWLVETGPGLSVPDWSVNRVSATIGCRTHGTIVQAGNDVFFLSETGRGVYALGQAPTSDEEGVWLPVSLDIRGYTDRINWEACDNARATYWDDLYLLSVPLDGSTYNNFMLIYSVTLKAWQGLWCYDIGGGDVGARDFARDRTDIKYTALLVATRDGILSRQTYPVERQYYDQNIDTTHQSYDSMLLSRSFTFGEDINQVRPHSARFQFLESTDPVTITAIADREAETAKRAVATSASLLSLTIPSFPFDLDTEGYLIQVLALLKTGICTELQFRLEATGNWTLFQIMASAFESMPILAR